MNTFRTNGFKKVLLWLTISGFIQIHSVSAQDLPQPTNIVSIIPRPQQLKPLQGSFAITPATRIFVDAQNKELNNLALMLADYLKRANLKLPVIEKKGAEGEKNAIVLTLTGAAN